MTDHSRVVLVLPRETEDAGRARRTPSGPADIGTTRCLTVISRRPEASVLKDTTTGCRDGKLGCRGPDKNTRGRVCGRRELKLRS